MIKKLLFTVIFSLILFQSILGVELTKKIEKKIDIPKSGEIILNNQMGRIEIIGQKEKGCELFLDVIVKTKKEKNAQKIIDQVQLDINPRGSQCKIQIQDVKDIVDDFEGSIEFNYYLKCHESIALEISNRFGSITANNFKSMVRLSNTNGSVEAQNHVNLFVNNRFGNIQVSNVTGTVDLNNVNGQIDIFNCQDKVHVSNGFGNTTVRDCKGEVNISTKNGLLEIHNISDGNLVCSNQFGNSEILTVGGNAKVSSRNGNIRLENVAGEAKVQGEFGEITIKNIDGNLNIRSQNGQITAENVMGNLHVDNSFAENILRDIHGTSEITSNNGKIILTHAFQPITISNSFAATVLSDISPQIKIETVNGDVKISELKSADIDIGISNSFGEIDLEIPENYQGSYDLSTNFGKIYLDQISGDRTYYKKTGDSEESIKLVNTNGNIKIRKK
ncbi:MAG: hypothetical protein JXQ65_12645 [Candidatus Marinimicrobia bacterium]|nr:hypothetical protein [Candidatus Neomarinimicrobiota bacterium]